MNTLNINTLTKACLVLMIALVVTGCETTPYDYSALIASKPRSILVIPPKNDSVDVNAPYTFLATISRPLAEKGYYVFPVALIDNFLKENGLPTPDEMNTVPLDKLREFTGADAVLYVAIEEWGQKYQVLSSNTIVKSNVKLIDARTGDLLWETLVYAEQSSGDGGGGLVGAMVGAIASQIAGSITDRTPDLSSRANHAAVNHRNRGLLPGPYSKIQQ